MLGVDEEDYYNPTIIQNSATRKKDEEEIHLHDIPQIKVYPFLVLSKVSQGYVIFLLSKMDTLMHGYILDRMKFSEASNIREIISPWIKHPKTSEVLEFPL